MNQRLFGCEHVRHPHNKILDIRFEIPPGVEGPPTVIPAETISVPCNVKSPRIIAIVLSQPMHTTQIRGLRQLEFDDKVFELDTFGEMFFLDCKHYLLRRGVDALRTYTSDYGVFRGG